MSPARASRRRSVFGRTRRQLVTSRASMAADWDVTGGTGRTYHRRRKQRFPLPFVIACLVVVAGVALALLGPRLFARGAGTEDPAATPDASATPTAVITSADRDPTPAFAEQAGTRIHLPVDPGAVTALAFHQASYNNALAMTSFVPDADVAQARALGYVPPTDNENPDPEIWSGSCLRLWREGRPGAPDTAADVGADPGTVIWSPVDGTVTQVKAYKLYNKYDDYEIHIEPAGRPDTEVVLIHVADPVIKPGDVLAGGVSRIGSVRKMSDKIGSLQLRSYTSNGGDHVHVQVNSLTLPK